MYQYFVLLGLKDQSSLTHHFRVFDLMAEALSLPHWARQLDQMTLTVTHPATQTPSSILLTSLDHSGQFLH